MTVLFKITSGKMAGAEKVVRHFPFRIGRSPNADFQLENAGVWDLHLELTFDPRAGFLLTTHPEAPAAINGESFHKALLRNGDAIEIGELKLYFWLAETRQASLGWREWLTWAAFVLILAGQFFLLYRLLP